MKQALSIAALAGCLALGLAACEKQGPAEHAGEKVDKAIDTIKNGGHETTADKVDDAADHVKEGVKDAADDLKK